MPFIPRSWTIEEYLLKKTADTLAISREGLDCIIHEILDMRELSAKWVPKYLSAL
jgi:hypothetical protein